VSNAGRKPSSASSSTVEASRQSQSRNIDRLRCAPLFQLMSVPAGGRSALRGTRRSPRSQVPEWGSLARGTCWRWTRALPAPAPAQGRRKPGCSSQPSRCWAGESSPRAPSCSSVLRCRTSRSLEGVGHQHPLPSPGHSGESSPRGCFTLELF